MSPGLSEALLEFCNTLLNKIVHPSFKWFPGPNSVMAVHESLFIQIHFADGLPSELEISSDAGKVFRGRIDMRQAGDETLRGRFSQLAKEAMESANKLPEPPTREEIYKKEIEVAECIRGYLKTIKKQD